MSRVSTEIRQEQIIDQAIKIIHQKGYSGLSIRELATQVGITEPAIYRHFRSKEDIVLGILERMDRLGENLHQEMSRLPDVRSKIRFLIENHLHFLEKNPEMTSVIFSEDIFEPRDAIRQKLHQIILKRQEMVKQILVEAQQQGQLVQVDPDELTSLILGYVRMVVLEWRWSRFGFPLVQRGHHMNTTIETLIFREE